MTIATKNGVPIVKGGVIASNCGCCDCQDCFKFHWFTIAPPSPRGCSKLGPGNYGNLGGVVTVTIPEKYQIPEEGLIIYIDGLVDDKFSVNDLLCGQELVCTSQPVMRSIRVFSRTVVFKFYDTVGGNVGGSITICVPNSKPAGIFSRTTLSEGGGSGTFSGWTISYPSYTPRFAGGSFASFVEQPCSLTPGTLCGPCDEPPLPQSIEVEITRGQTAYATAVIGESPEGGPDQPKFACAVAWGYPEGSFSLSRFGLQSYRYVFPGSLGEIFAIISTGPNKILRIEFRMPFLRFAAFADTDTPPSQEYLLSNNFLDSAECSGGFFPTYYPKGDTTQPAFVVRKCSAAANDYSWFAITEGCTNGSKYERTITNQNTGNPQPPPEYRVCSSGGCTFPLQLTAKATTGVISSLGVLLTTTNINLHRLQGLARYMFTFAASGADGYRDSDGVPFATRTATGSIDSVRMVYGSGEIDMFPANESGVCALYSGGFPEQC